MPPPLREGDHNRRPHATRDHRLSYAPAIIPPPHATDHPAPPLTSIIRRPYAQGDHPPPPQHGDIRSYPRDHAAALRHRRHSAAPTPRDQSPPPRCGSPYALAFAPRALASLRPGQSPLRRPVPDAPLRSSLRPGRAPARASPRARSTPPLLTPWPAAPPLPQSAVAATRGPPSPAVKSRSGAVARTPIRAAAPGRARDAPRARGVQLVCAGAPARGRADSMASGSNSAPPVTLLDGDRTRQPASGAYTPSDRVGSSTKLRLCSTRSSPGECPAHPVIVH